MRIFRRVVLACGLSGLVLLCVGQTGCSEPATDPEAGVMEAARRAFLDGRFLTAEDGYQYYLQAYPEGRYRLEAWKRLADISKDGRDAPGEAATLLEAALLEFGSDPKAAAGLLARAGELRLQRKEYDKAAAHEQALLALADLDAGRRLTAFLQLAGIRVATHDGAGALAIYDACLHSPLGSPEKARCALAQGELLTRLDRSVEAEPLLRGLYEDTQNAPALRAQAGFDLGQLYEARNDKTAAKALYQAIRPLHPNPRVVEKRLEYLQGDGKGQTSGQ